MRGLRRRPALALVDGNRPPLLDCTVRTIVGGATRRESVARGLAAIEADRVLVHDAARPFVPAQVIGLVLSTGGCIGIGLASRDSGTSSVVGLALVALATLLWASVTVVTRGIGDRYDSWWLYTPGTVLGAVIMLAVDAPHLHEFAHVSLRGWFAVVWLGTASSAFIYYSLARVMTVISGTTATSISTIMALGTAL